MRVLALQQTTENGFTTSRVKEMDIKDELRTYYELTNCDTIDILTRKIGGKPYCIVVDDTALLKENPVPSMIDEDFMSEKADGKYLEHQRPETIYGSVVITGPVDEEGNLTALSQDDIKSIKANIIYAFFSEAAKNGVPSCLSIIKFGY